MVEQVLDVIIDDEIDDIDEIEQMLILYIFVALHNEQFVIVDDVDELDELELEVVELEVIELIELIELLQYAI